jgi:hypothetical protein
LIATGFSFYLPAGAWVGATVLFNNLEWGTAFSMPAGVFVAALAGTLSFERIFLSRAGDSLPILAFGAGDWADFAILFGSFFRRAEPGLFGLLAIPLLVNQAAGTEASM